MNALELDIRAKSFPAPGGHTQVIEGINIDVAQGEFVAMLGPSGCGKTTAMQIASGLDNAFDGTVRYGPGVADRLAYVFQQPRLLPWRTVRENIELVFTDPVAHAGDITAALADVGLLDAGLLYPGQLSLGMQRRAALARAFVLRPRLLLMDEPFVSLDDTLAQNLRGLLRSLLDSHPAAVLFITHDWREAVMLADRLVFLTPSPATIRAELAVTLSREQRLKASVVERFRRDHAKAFEALPESPLA
jgi:NitT/TauT family transport system ATP-binding protein